MIPTSFNSRLSLPSPQQTERDLARLIHRTVDMAMSAKRQMGYAAVNIGCDGVQRVTMFDGSSCQTSGDVCLATREEGITVCIDSPSGAGLAFQRVSFAAPACSPVTGWWIVDAEGYMYRVPSTVAAYWPMTADPTIPEQPVTLVRSGTWAALMCGAGLDIPLNADGGAEWVLIGEGGESWMQRYGALVGGRRSIVNALPTVTVRPSELQPNVVTIVGDIAERDGDPEPLAVNVTATFTGRDVNGVNLAAGEEYRARISAYGTVTKGAKAPAGESVPPAWPVNRWHLADVVVRPISTAFPYTTWPIGWGGGLDGELVVELSVTLALALRDRLGEMDLQRIYPSTAIYADTHVGIWRGVLSRDSVSPNAGSRVTEVTLPAAETGMVTGIVRLAFGYPFGSQARYNEGAGAGLAPYERPTSMSRSTRVLGDMALAYRRGLAVEYGEVHVNLDGEQITDPSAFVSLDELDYAHGPALDVGAGLVGLPGGEVALFGQTDLVDVRIGKRYRVRPAPDTALTVAVEHQAKGAWGVDPNAWTMQTQFSVAAWGAGPAQVTVFGDQLSAATAPGREVECYLWEYTVGSPTYLTAPVSYHCLLGETTAGVTELLDMNGDPFVIAASVHTLRFLTIVGPKLYASYGWTVEIDGVESAMSPLTDFGATGYAVPSLVIYSLKLTVPTGPTGTARRHIYRFAFDYGNTSSPARAPWHYGEQTDPESIDRVVGGVYDRMCRRVATIEGNVTTVVYDEDTSLALAGTRPPSPLVYLGPIAVDAPRPVHLLQPMEL